LTQRGSALAWKLLTTNGVYHELGQTFCFRDVSAGDKSSHSVRGSAGRSLKGSFSHCITIDNRNDSFMPTRGSLFKLFNEISIFGTKFSKSEAECQFCFEMPKGFSFSSTIRSGLLLQFDGRRSNIADRFFLGGPSSVRGFNTRGIGPRAPGSTSLNSDSLGGDAFWSVGLGLLTPVPLMETYESFKLHFFANAGSLFPLEGKGNIPLGRIFKSPIAASLGGGIVLRTNFCRLEVNLSSPWIRGEQDRLSPRVQIGIGANFL
jgi:outer membrane protein insertion porin family